MRNDELSLVYLVLGNKFRITEGKFRHINLLQYLNLLMTETEILKIDLPIMGSDFDAPKDEFELDVKCLCYIPNIAHEGKLVPNMETIGGINLFTNAGNKCWIIDEVKAHQKFFNEYVYKELSEKHSNFLKQKSALGLPPYFYDDWNTEDVALKIDSEINEDLSYFTNVFEGETYHPNRFGFYSWLFSDDLLIYDVLSEEIFANGVEVTYLDSHEFSKLKPIKKDN